MTTLPFLSHAPWAEALGWTLLHSLWQGALIAALLALVASLLGPGAARARYLCGVLGMAMTLLMAATTFVQVYSPEPATPPAKALAPLVDVHQVQVAAQTPLVKEAASWLDQARQRIQPLTPWIATLWLLGFGLLCLRWLSSYSYTQSLRYREAETMSYAWQAEVNRLARRLGLARTVLLIESSRIQSPLTLGHFKPVVLVPLGLLSGLDQGQIEAILCHELAHIRRHDFLINLLVSLVEVLFFYHPAIWWMGRELRQAREHCCDDLAVATCGNAMQYAQTLARLAETTTTPHLAPGLASRRKPLLMRVKRLLAPHTLPQSRGRVVVASALLLVSVGLGWLAPVRAKSPDQHSWHRALTGPLGNGIPWFAEQPARYVPFRSWPDEAIAMNAASSQRGSVTVGKVVIFTEQLLAPIVCCVVDTPPPAAPAPPTLPTQPAPMPPMPPTPPMPPVPSAPDVNWNGDSAAYGAAWQAYAQQMSAWEESWTEAYQVVWKNYAQEMNDWAKTLEAQKDVVWQEQRVKEMARQIETEHGRIEQEAARHVNMATQVQAQAQREVEQAMREVARAQRDQERRQRERMQEQREVEAKQREVEQEQRRVESEQREAEAKQRGVESEQRKVERDMRQLRAEQAAMAEEMRVVAQELRQARGQGDALRIHQEVLTEELIKDGMLADPEGAIDISAKKGEITINGRSLQGQQLDKYHQLLQQMGIDTKAGKVSIHMD
jgi:beta-lactamase regulating signal transducer with metallopeptidase domain